MKITPDLIPHSEFHKGSWLLSLKRPSWYYFKKPGSRNKTIGNKAFISTVDQPLKKLVKFLHQKGIQTTPSCSGHDMNERNLDLIFPSLEKDLEDIRTKGLIMKDVESGKLILYKDKNYQLPWTRKEFVRQLKKYQHVGVLGIKTGKNREFANKILKLKIEGMRIEKQPGVILIFTNEQNKHDIFKIWKFITDQIMLVFKSNKMDK